jgi:hypothetical protein
MIKKIQFGFRKYAWKFLEFDRMKLKYFVN